MLHAFPFYIERECTHNREKHESKALCIQALGIMKRSSKKERNYKKCLRDVN
jgi:hypothetical protein